MGKGGKGVGRDAPFRFAKVLLLEEGRDREWNGTLRPRSLVRFPDVLRGRMRTFQIRCVDGCSSDSNRTVVINSSQLLRSLTSLHTLARNKTDL